MEQPDKAPISPTSSDLRRAHSGRFVELPNDKPLDDESIVAFCRKSIPTWSKCPPDMNFETKKFSGGTHSVVVKVFPTGPDADVLEPQACCYRFIEVHDRYEYLEGKAHDDAQCVNDRFVEMAGEAGVAPKVYAINKKHRVIECCTGGSPFERVGFFLRLNEQYLDYIATLPEERSPASCRLMAVIGKTIGTMHALPHDWLSKSVSVEEFEKRKANPCLFPYFITEQCGINGPNIERVRTGTWLPRDGVFGHPSGLHVDLHQGNIMVESKAEEGIPKAGDKANVKVTGEQGTITMTNGHAHKLCSKWYLTEELEKQGLDVKLIDWEGVCLGHRGLDLSYLFINSPGSTLESRRAFAVGYLQGLGEPTDVDTVDTFLLDVERCMPLALVCQTKLSSFFLPKITPAMARLTQRVIDIIENLDRYDKADVLQQGIVDFALDGMTLTKFCLRFIACNMVFSVLDRRNRGIFKLPVSKAVTWSEASELAGKEGAVLPTCLELTEAGVASNIADLWVPVQRADKQTGDFGQIGSASKALVVPSHIDTKGPVPWAETSDAADGRLVEYIYIAQMSLQRLAEVAGTPVDLPVYRQSSVVQLSGKSDGEFTASAGMDMPTGNSPYTVACWICVTDEQCGALVIWGGAQRNSVVGLSVEGMNKVSNFWWENDLCADVHLIQDYWHHVTATYDGTTRKIFLDFKLVAEDKPSGLAVPCGDNLTIGHVDREVFGDEKMRVKGQIKHVEVWKSALDIVALADKLEFFPWISDGKLDPGYASKRILTSLAMFHSLPPKHLALTRAFLAEQGPEVMRNFAEECVLHGYFGMVGASGEMKAELRRLLKEG